MNDPVFYKECEWKYFDEILPTGWYFWDECWLDCHGPYATEWHARGQLSEYFRLFLGE